MQFNCEEMDVDLSTLKLQESEVSAVKYVHYEDLITQLKAGDPQYVPCDPINGGYAQLFSTLRTKFNKS